MCSQILSGPQSLSVSCRAVHITLHCLQAAQSAWRQWELLHQIRGKASSSATGTPSNCVHYAAAALLLAFTAPYPDRQQHTAVMAYTQVGRGMCRAYVVGGCAFGTTRPHPLDCSPAKPQLCHAVQYCQTEQMRSAQYSAKQQTKAKNLTEVSVAQKQVHHSSATSNLQPKETTVPM